MNNTLKISNYTLLLIISLSISVWWIFMGLDLGFKFGAGFDDLSYFLTLGGRRHTIMPILALILIPLCAREYQWGLLSAMILGLSTFCLVLAHVIYMLIIRPSGFESIISGPIIWTVIQVFITIFGFLSLKKQHQKREQPTGE